MADDQGRENKAFQYDGPPQPEHQPNLNHQYLPGEAIQPHNIQPQTYSQMYTNNYQTTIPQSYTTSYYQPVNGITPGKNGLPTGSSQHKDPISRSDPE